MRRRETLAGLFVLIMLGLGGAVMLHWRAQEPRVTFPDQNSFSVEWTPATPAEYLAAKTTIGGQLAAFQSGDFRKASVFQSEILQQSFVTTNNFRMIIQHRYPEFCHFASVTYGRCFAARTGDNIRMEILLTGPSGSRTRAFYFLHKENGLYRVAQVLTSDDVFRFMHPPIHPPGSPLRVGEDPGPAHPPIGMQPVMDPPHH